MVSLDRKGISLRKKVIAKRYDINEAINFNGHCRDPRHRTLLVSDPVSFYDFPSPEGSPCKDYKLRDFSNFT